MAAGGYKISDKQGIHWVTFAVVAWVDVFTNQRYRAILLEILRYCQECKMKRPGFVQQPWIVQSCVTNSGQLQGVAQVDLKIAEKNTILQQKNL